jgi:hypothetical protein
MLLSVMSEDSGEFSSHLRFNVFAYKRANQMAYSYLTILALINYSTREMFAFAEAGDVARASAAHNLRPPHSCLVET